jgi:hypothetical protein
MKVYTNAKRYFCWTINNPTADDDKQLTDLCDNSLCNYLCYGKENVSTPHYQGYVELTSPQRFSWIKKRLTRAHLEPKKGSRTQARDYCFKEDSAPFEYGNWIPDRQGARNDLVVVQKLIEKGIDMHEIHQKHFESACKYNKFFDRYKNDHDSGRNFKTKVSIYWGTTGTGKTRKAMEEPGAKQIDYANYFFEDPCGAPTLVFDDIDNPVRLFGRRLFLRITDRYAMQVNIKGGHANWSPKHIIFTTNTNPNQWKLDAACMRRIDEMVEFNNTDGTSADGGDKPKDQSRVSITP